MKNNLADISRQFDILGDFVSAETYGSGHINDTYAASYSQAGKIVRYIHQKINRNVFREPEKVMENVERVTRHLSIKLHDNGVHDASRRALSLIPAKNRKFYHIDNRGYYWRTYLLIEDAKTYDIIEKPEQAFSAASAFANFQKLLVDLPGKRLYETIPDFHNTVKRFKDLEGSIKIDKNNRVESCEKEIDFVMNRRDIIPVIIDRINSGSLPERITHNDTKLNNVMIDVKTGESICIIDLDTVMPGTVLYDFGDLVRTSTSPAAEDEKDLSKVIFRIDMFEALVKGYLSEADDFLTGTEREHLAFCGKLITLETGIRFLTDYLDGDIYFKTEYNKHNLIRSRTQFKLVESMEKNENEMKAIVKKYV